MSDYIIVGIDAHVGSLVVKWAVDKGEPVQCSYPNTANGRRGLERKLARLSAEHAGARVVCAYEASYQGSGLCRDLEAAGFVCHVLAPTKIARPTAVAKKKTDARDAVDLLEVLRGHLLAGNRLPGVWVPDVQTLQDRELVRGRQDVADKLGRLRTQVASLLARWDVSVPRGVGGGWTQKWRRWAQELADKGLAGGAGEWLGSLLRQVASLEQEKERLEELIGRLSEEDRYRERVHALRARPGVGLLVAMVYLTEMGELGRFCNRRQVASYLGLCPSSHDSGDSERKGHITRQGSGRVRKALCQAVWAALRCSAQTKKAYGRLARGQAKRRKSAIVALMRQLAIKLWHAGMEVERPAPSAALA